MADFEDVVRIGGSWPEVTEGLFYGTPGLKVRNKGFCRIWGDRDFKKADVAGTDVLVVFCPLDEKAALIAGSRGTLFSAPHYDGHGSVLVRLSDVSDDVLAERLFESYLIVAPPALARSLQTREGDSPTH